METSRSYLRSLTLPASMPTCTPSTRGPADWYANRELSWLEFNGRVLSAAEDPRVPLYERLKFLGIFESNLDEFFMVRVAGIQAQRANEVTVLSPDGLLPAQILRCISDRVRTLAARAYRIWHEELRPALAQTGVRFADPRELAPADRARLDRHFREQLYPVLTPIAVDPAHPFPHVRNRCINLGILFEPEDDDDVPDLGVVQVPTTLPRLIGVPTDDPSNNGTFVLLEDLICCNMELLFPHRTATELFSFRVTRNFDIEIDEEEGEDLLRTLQAELRRRERGNAVRLEVTDGTPEEAVARLCQQLGLSPDLDAYRVPGPLLLANLPTATKHHPSPAHCDPPFSPQYVPPFRDADDFFSVIREHDVLLHHPYESFEAVIDFLLQAAADPDVLAIKMTLYRTGGESPLVRALQQAAENGKQVTAVVELKARFDEQSNIQWARTLERSGVNVVYGVLGLKTHAKILLVVRKEPEGIRRYVHLATGNYNQQTAKLYEDISLFTSRPAFGEDASAVFNLLTGYSAPPELHALCIAPLGLREAIMGLIEREAAHARAGRPAAIVAKMNSLVDPAVIGKLYDAARAGVRIDLLVRGMCCLRPGVPGLSDTIRVHAIIDRFLEHARIFSFENGGDDELYLASADWMTRNFERRIELLFPVVDARLRHRLRHEVLATMRADNWAGWLQNADGTYSRAPQAEDGSPPLRCQEHFMELARIRAEGSGEDDAPLGHSAPPPSGADASTLAAWQAQFAVRRRRRKRN